MNYQLEMPKAREKIPLMAKGVHLAIPLGARP